ncbi:MAG: 30S ribosomal protein S7 [Clostridiaceae bacterium]|nr:30S ribosomal protein S7 [Clostridiaceae bacterium]
MPRKGHIAKRVILPDPVYNDVRIAKLINQVMKDGKKDLARRIVYGSFDLIEERGQSPFDVFNKALENVMPVLEVKARRVGGSNYQVPIEVRPERRQTLALRWIVAAARARGERTMIERLAYELMDASNQTGAAFRRKEEIHRMAEANRAFAHYRW